jgi:hypothetical protein
VKKTVILLVILFFLAGCSFSPTPDPTPMPTFTSTITETPTPPPTNTATPIPEATATITHSSNAGYKVNIWLDPSFFSGEPSVAAAWLGYASARTEWIQTNVLAEEMAQNGYHRAFEEEVAARSSLAKIWKELKSSKGGAKDTHLDDLLKVYEAGYIREYTWTFLATDEWSQPEGLRLDEFKTWAQVNIPDHEPKTLADVEITVDE